MHVTKSEPLPRARFGGKGLLAKKTVKEEIWLADFVWRRDTELLGGLAQAKHFRPPYIRRSRIILARHRRYV